MNAMSMPRHNVEGYVLAVFDGLALLFDQADVAVVEHADRLPEVREAVRSSTAGTRPLFVIARHGRGSFDLACEEVRTHPAGSVEIHRLPSALKGKCSPFHAFASVGERIAFYCSAARFAEMLQREENEKAPGSPAPFCLLRQDG